MTHFWLDSGLHTSLLNLLTCLCQHVEIHLLWETSCCLLSAAYNMEAQPDIDITMGQSCLKKYNHIVISIQVKYPTKSLLWVMTSHANTLALSKCQSDFGLQRLQLMTGNGVGGDFLTESRCMVVDHTFMVWGRLAHVSCSATAKHSPLSGPCQLASAVHKPAHHECSNTALCLIWKALPKA